jgi:hypothetical protein
MAFVQLDPHMLTERSDAWVWAEIQSISPRGRPKNPLGRRDGMIAGESILPDVQKVKLKLRVKDSTDFSIPEQLVIRDTILAYLVKKHDTEGFFPIKKTVSRGKTAYTLATTDWQLNKRLPGETLDDYWVHLKDLRLLVDGKGTLPKHVEERWAHTLLNGDLSEALRIISLPVQITVDPVPLASSFIRRYSFTANQSNESKSSDYRLYTLFRFSVLYITESENKDAANMLLTYIQDDSRFHKVLAEEPYIIGKLKQMLASPNEERGN